MGLFYTVSRSNIALVTTTDLLTLQTAAGRALKLHEIAVGGMGTASAANELGVFRQTTLGVTGTGAIVAEKSNPALPAAAFSALTTWGTQPVLSAVALLRLPVNSNGGVFRWVAKPGQEIEIAAQGAALAVANALSLRSAIGTGLVSVHLVLEEI